VVCFLTTGLHHLVVGPYVVSKPEAFSDEAVRRLSPLLPLSKRLVRGSRSGLGSHVEHTYAIETTKSRAFGPTAVPISAEMFRILQQADGKTSFAALMSSSTGASASEPDQLTRELVTLWTGRFISLRPLAGATPNRDANTSGTYTSIVSAHGGDR
jgi:carbamoyltransferase